MNYIYDIYLNLNEILFDFFDWNKNDRFTHIKKIPIFKIPKEELKLFVCRKIKIDKNLLLKIYKKTEIWNMNNKINYCALFSNNDTILAIEFDKSGKSIKKSFLFIDEELEVLEIIYKLQETYIDFNILNKEEKIFKTRKQMKEEKFIRQELNNIEDKKLTYIYFECFGKQEKNKKIILDNINKISKNSKIYKNLYNILKLTSTTRK